MLKYDRGEIQMKLKELGTIVRKEFIYNCYCNIVTEPKEYKKSHVIKCLMKSSKLTVISKTFKIF